MPTDAEYVGDKIDKLTVAIKELTEKVSVPVVVNNSLPSELVEKIEGPNAAGLAMLVGVTTGFAFSLNEILDNPNLDIMQRAKKLREIAARGTKMADEYNQMLEQVRKESEGGK